MYRLLVVDDEPQDRNIVKILINKQYPNLFEIIEAKSGMQVLEIMRQCPVDLILLDLNMPGLSGLNVIRELGTPVYIIVLTAYNYFEYAQEALRYGVKDYILKPPIRSELYEAIDRFLQNPSTSQENLPSERNIIFRELAAQLLFYGDNEKIHRSLQSLRLGHPSVSLAVLLSEQSLSDEIANTLNQFLKEQTIVSVLTTFQGGIAVIFFWNSPEESKLVTQLLPSLQNRSGMKLLYQIEIDEYSVVPQVFVRLCNEGIPVSNIPEIREQAQNLEAALRRQDFIAAMQYIRESASCWEYGTHCNESKLQVISLLASCTKNIFANANKRGAYKRLSGLLDAISKEQFLDAAADYLNWMILEIQQSVYTNSHIIYQVIHAIQQDCAKPWTLEGVAADLKISPYYLSRLFKEQTGTSFTDFLTECRLEKAVELMKQPELSLSQIGDLVGYSDSNYFSRVFKKRRNLSARQFRKQFLAK